MKRCPVIVVLSSFFLAAILLLNMATCSYTFNNDKRNYKKEDLSMEKKTVDSFDDAMITKYDFNSWKDTVEGETIHFHKGFTLDDTIVGWTVINKQIEIDPIPFVISDAKYWMENKGKKILITISICESNQIAHQTIFSSLKYISYPNPWDKIRRIVK